MRSPRALSAVLLAVAFVISGVPFPAMSPAAAQESATGIGSAVPVTDVEGAPVGSITVNDVIDPFTDFDPAYPPEEGGRYVVVDAAFDADSGARFDIAPGTIVLQDDAGFLWNQTTLYLPDEALIPELSSQTLAPGSRVTGVIGFAVPEGSVPARVFYQPETSRLFLLGDLLGEDVPAMGDAVEIADSEGGIGTVAVTELTDPFEELDPGQTPPEGMRFVMATLVYENPSDGRFFIEPYGLLLRGTNGNLLSSSSVTRLEGTDVVPNLTNAQLAPGDRLSGAVVFAVPVDQGVAGLYTSPVSGQLVQLASLEEDASAGTGDAASTSLAGDACAEVEQWLAVTQERIARATALSLEDAELPDLEILTEHMAEYVDMADAQLAEAAPAEVEAANKALIATLSAYGGSIDQILGAGDPGNDPALELTEGMNTFNDAGDRLQDIEAELARVADECGL